MTRAMITREQCRAELVRCLVRAQMASAGGAAKKLGAETKEPTCSHDSTECPLGCECAGNDECPPTGLENRNRITCPVCGERVCVACGTLEWYQCL